MFIKVAEAPCLLHPALITTILQLERVFSKESTDAGALINKESTVAKVCVHVPLVTLPCSTNCHLVYLYLH